MAKVITGNPVDIMRARAVVMSGITQQQVNEFQQRAEESQQAIVAAGGIDIGFASIQQSYFNDESIMIGQQIMETVNTTLNTDLFIPITYEERETESFVTMSYIAAHPEVNRQITKGLINGYKDEIGILPYEDIMDNSQFLDVMEGVHDNKYMDGMMIESYSEVVSDGEPIYRLGLVEKEQALEMYDLIDGFIDAGIDFT